MTKSDVGAIDVSSPDLYQQDSWQPLFKHLREHDPVHLTPESQFGPYWSITRFQDIKSVDSDHRTFSSSPTIGIGDQPEDFEMDNFIVMDPPRHDEHRNAVVPTVAPRRLQELEALIRRRAIELLDNVPVGEIFDWVTHISNELTLQMLATLLDFPMEERHKLGVWTDMASDCEDSFGSTQFTEEARRDGLMECLQVFADMFRERAAIPRGERWDFISMLAHDANTADMIDRPMELLGTVTLLIVGGNDTTRNSVSGGVLALNEYPEEYDRLRSNNGLIPNMVSEIIRWQSPVIHMRRTATRDVVFGGKEIKHGDKVVMRYVSGNRDESVFEDPERFMIDHARARHHVAFGFGVHRCMGNQLAELQLRVLWEEIMRRFRFVEVVGEVRRARSNIIRGITELPVRVHPW